MREREATKYYIYVGVITYGEISTYGPLTTYEVKKFQDTCTPKEWEKRKNKKAY